MNTEEQIQEMARICCGICEFERCGECLNEHDLGDCYMAMRTAQKLYNAGYRKVSDAVAEIFEELDRFCMVKPSSEEDYEELKKKYIEREVAE